MSWDFSTEPEFEKKLEWMRRFMHDEVYPLEVLDIDEREFMRAIRPLQEEVKRQKLWATHLPPELGGEVEKNPAEHEGRREEEKAAKLEGEQQ